MAYYTSPELIAQEFGGAKRPKIDYSCKECGHPYVCNGLAHEKHYEGCQHWQAPSYDANRVFVGDKQICWADTETVGSEMVDAIKSAFTTEATP